MADRKRWVVAAKRADFDAIAKQFGISPMLARIIRNRDITEYEDIKTFLQGSIDDLHDPAMMKDMRQAVLMLMNAIENGTSIRIMGDYDVDGICATYILYKSISSFGGTVSYRLPNRVKDGYGINNNMIDEALADGVRLILTCDNGIAAVDEIAYAKQLGMRVIVTDHHEVPLNPPVADAMVDPKQTDCKYPYTEICGAVIAYKLVQLLEKQYDSHISEELLPFAAMATVCDVMPLLNENRIIVKCGLEAMKHTDNLGLKTLMDVTGIKRDALSPYHLGFILGPCINATGRLDTAERALQLFLCKEERQAVLYAKELKELNDSRKDMTLFYTGKAIELVEHGDENNPPMKDMPVLVIFLPDCHESIAGIVAGKVKENFYRPTIVLTRGEEFVKGSARSIEDYSMYDALVACEDLFIKFGGHKMAAGMSLHEGNVPILRKRLNDECKLSKEQLTEKVMIDIPMPLSYVTREFTEELSCLAPFGVSNSKPIFAQKDLKLSRLDVRGKSRNVVSMRFEGETLEGIYFTDGEAFVREYKVGDRVSVCYCPEINAYMGHESVQLSIKEIMKQ